ncbi:ABC transporter permease [Mycobacterium sp. GA-2829]|uniref:ABC transporter permease n=1 Tax=Mycobacterium sp. GA-2829 TaxID=1772283 RepID=UPI0009EC2B70|nr:ABC transporter permease [Mycobacterium sp. GA-2829]
MTVLETPLAQAPADPKQSFSRRHPVLRMFAARLASGVLSVVVVSAIVYWATLILPGNAASAILGQSATPERIAELTERLHLDDPILSRYWQWLTGAIRLDFGNSLANGQPVTDYLLPRLENSVVLVVVAAVVSTLLGLALGAWAALRRDKPVDHGLSVVALVASALPEFVVGVFVVLTFSVAIFHWFPAVSVLPPGIHAWERPMQLVLPVLTLVIVVTPYVFRMMRAATIEALDSEYVELATLKGVSRNRILLRHAVPNAMAPTIQVIGLNLLYLAGGIVLVETVFNYQGLGLALVNAVNTRDVPVIQFIVVLLAVFYVVLNIATDLLVLLVSPRKRQGR